MVNNKITFNILNDERIEASDIAVYKNGAHLIVEYVPSKQYKPVPKISKIVINKDEKKAFLARFNYELNGHIYYNIMYMRDGNFYSPHYTHLDLIDKQVFLKLYDNILEGNFDFSELDIRERARKYFDLIFNSVDVPVNKKGLRYIREEESKTIFIEVNPNKLDSRVSEFARNGEQLMYIINQNGVTLCANIGGENEYIGDTSQYKK